MDVWVKIDVSGKKNITYGLICNYFGFTKENEIYGKIDHHFCVTKQNLNSWI